MNVERPVRLLFWAILLFPVAALTATTAEAQERARTAEIVCFEDLDAGASRDIVRALVGRDVEIVHDAQTNCLVVVGARDLTETRRVLTQLEARMRDRRTAHGNRRGRTRPPG